MATKKQKREAAEAKRAKFEAEHRESGLRALKADQEQRKEVEAAYKERADKAELERERLTKSLISRGLTYDEAVGMVRGVTESVSTREYADVALSNDESIDPIDIIKVRDFHQNLVVGGFFEGGSK